MAESPDLEARVSALETTVTDLSRRVHRNEHDAASARVLAGGADRDVAEIRTEVREFREQNNRVLNTMREDLVDGFIEMRGKFDALASGQQRIAELLNTIIDRDGRTS